MNGKSSSSMPKDQDLASFFDIEGLKHSAETECACECGVVGKGQWLCKACGSCQEKAQGSLEIAMGTEARKNG
jgi:hypothetical protein